MYSNFFLKSFRILLFPLAVLFWVVIVVRNWLYDKNILKSVSYGLPLICVGNLSVGGTGKSPMVEYLVSRLKDHFQVGILSRGYKRKTSGYALADNESTALEIGDEPMQFYQKFPGIPVAVGEERIEAIPLLLQDRPGIQCIILDDAFQHRAIRAGLNILLTDFKNLYTRDFLLPAGDLRDVKSSSQRADIIIVTKCEQGLTEKEKNEIIRELKPRPHQHVFFTTNVYSSPYHIKRRQETIQLSQKAEILLITGIANPQPLKELMEDYSKAYFLMHFPDHHIFTTDDWNEIRKRFNQMEAKLKYILTTEKDAVRLAKYGNELNDLPLYVIPLEHHFLFNQDEQFLDIVINFIKKHTGQDVSKKARQQEVGSNGG